MYYCLWYNGEMPPWQEDFHFHSATEMAASLETANLETEVHLLFMRHGLNQPKSAVAHDAFAHDVATVLDAMSAVACTASQFCLNLEFHTNYADVNVQLLALDLAVIIKDTCSRFPFLSLGVEIFQTELQDAFVAAFADIPPSVKALRLEPRLSSAAVASLARLLRVNTTIIKLACHLRVATDAEMLMRHGIHLQRLLVPVPPRWWAATVAFHLAENYSLGAIGHIDSDTPWSMSDRLAAILARNRALWQDRSVLAIARPSGQHGYVSILDETFRAALFRALFGDSLSGRLL